MNTVLIAAQVSLCFVNEPSDSFRLQAPTAVPTLFLGFLRRAYRTTSPWPSVLGTVRHLGFAVRVRARHDSRPNRVHLRYGLIVHLRLLSTPPHGDAVTFGYRVPENPDEDLHLAGSMRLQAHTRPLRGHPLPLTFRKSSRQFLGILGGARPPLRPPVGPRVEPQEPDHRTLGLGQVGHQHLRFAFRGANLVTLDRREHFD